jgi:hypothetical protein
MKVKKFLFVVAVVVIAFFAIVLGRWYQYVTSAPQPYDEVGIELNRYMPGFLNKWGCDQLKARFGRQVPPYGCQAESGNGLQWR